MPQTVPLVFIKTYPKLQFELPVLSSSNSEVFGSKEPGTSLLPKYLSRVPLGCCSQCSCRFFMSTQDGWLKLAAVFHLGSGWPCWLVKVGTGGR